MGADASDPDAVDVDLSGPLTAASSLAGPDDDICFFIHGSDVFEQAQPMIEQHLLDALDDPDGSGPADARLANGLEATLAGLTTHGTVPQGNGVDVDSGFSGARVDDSGLVLLQSTRYAADSGPAGASPFTQSVSWGGDVPLAAEVTPSGRPYDYAVSVSVSSLNQLFAAQTQMGAFTKELADVSVADPAGTHQHRGPDPPRAPPDPGARHRIDRTDRPHGEPGRPPDRRRQE